MPWINWNTLKTDNMSTVQNNKYNILSKDAIARLFEYGEVSDAQRIWRFCVCGRYDSVHFGDIVGSRLDTKL